MKGAHATWSEDPRLPLLGEVLEVLAGLRVQAWIDMGTLLGITRDGDLVPWDHDIDLSTWADQWGDQRGPLVRDLECRGRRVYEMRDMIFVTPGRADGEAWPVSIHLYRRGPDGEARLRFHVAHLHGHAAHGTRWSVRAVRLGLRAGTALTKVTRLHPEVLERLGRPPVQGSVARRLRRSGLARLARDAERWMREWSADLEPSRESLVPGHFFDGFDRVNWRGLDLQAPQDVEAYLAFRYGAEWRTPLRSWDTLTQDGTVVAGQGRR